jgi:hypothetical protein
VRRGQLQARAQRVAHRYTFGSGATLTVPAHGAVAFHINAKFTAAAAATYPATVPVTFSVKEVTAKGDKVWVVGNAPQLGNWDINKAVSTSMGSLQTSDSLPSSCSPRLDTPLATPSGTAPSLFRMSTRSTNMSRSPLAR